MKNILILCCIYASILLCEPFAALPCKLALSYTDPFDKRQRPVSGLPIVMCDISGKTVLYISQLSSPNGVVWIPPAKIPSLNVYIFIIAANDAARVATGGTNFINLLNINNPVIPQAFQLAGTAMAGKTYFLNVSDGIPILAAYAAKNARDIIIQKFNYAPLMANIYYDRPPQ